MKSPKPKSVGKPTVSQTKIVSDLAFKHMPQEVAQTVLDTANPDQLETSLTTFLALQNKDVDFKEAILLDYYVSAMWWARGQPSFDALKVSGVFTVVSLMLDNIREHHLSLTDNVMALKKLMAGIGGDASGESFQSGGLEFFSQEEANAVVSYVTRDLFQHYRLYEFMATRTPAEEVLGVDLAVEIAPNADLPFPPPLPEGLLADEHSLYVVAPQESSITSREISLPGAVAATVSEVDRAVSDDLLSQLTPAEVQRIIEEVCTEMLGGLELEVAASLREKENSLLNRINKIHNVT